MSDDEYWGNIHEAIGWFTCANLACRWDLTRLEGDHVTLITTANMRRFCDVECVIQGEQEWLRFIAHHTMAMMDDEDAGRPVRDDWPGHTRGRLREYLKAVPSREERESVTEAHP